METKKKFGGKEIAVLGMFIALSYVVMYLSKFIPVNIQGFLTFDLKDVIIAICGFIFGPIEAIVVSVIVSVIEMLTVSSTGPIGLLMNVLSTCAFVVPAALIYKFRKKFSGAIFGLIVGIICMAIVMILWNWLITPIYQGVPREVVVPMLPTVFLPFNLVKGGINAALTLALYRPLVSALRKAGLVSASAQAGNGNKKKLTIIVTICSVVVLITLVLVVLVWQKII